MSTLPPPKMPNRPSDSFHIALLILCAVGFLVLYFKVDLDGSLNASYIANVSQQVERVERRLMMAEKKMMMQTGKGMKSEDTLAPAVAFIQGAPKVRYQIGLSPKFERESIGLGDSIISAGLQCVNITILTFRSLWGLFNGIVPTREIAGPISIVMEVANSSERGFEYLIGLTAFLSLSLAILNLLPIPVLDGGHLFFFAIEALIRKPLNKRAVEYATRFGMVVLLLLMVLAFSNDFRRLGEMWFGN